MRKYLLILILISSSSVRAQDTLIYHPIKTDANGNIISWYSPESGKAWSHIIDLTWHFWDTMRNDLNGIPYYMNRQVWRPDMNDPRGLGGDQLAMALSSWRLLYAFSGHERVKENMKFIADYYLTHSLSPSNAAWPNIPFPYNTLVYSGIYDGDMVIGKDFTQPDKAGSFGIELVNLYKMMGAERYPNRTGQRYLDAAIQIANTLGKHTKAGDYDHSPMPFKVNAYTNAVGEMQVGYFDRKENGGFSHYTSNYSGTLELFLALRQLKVGDTALYRRSFNTILAWMKKYPLKNNRWGPFFEDVPNWSDTQINAITFAQFMMNHPQYFDNWKTDVKGIFDWVYKTLANRKWEKYGVTVVNEQTVYQQPGNSHTSRQASAEIQYSILTGDRSRMTNALRQLNWATYMVDHDGKNRYPGDENWLTDGYGDYIRHYIRSMAFMPEWAPTDEDHILSSTSVIQQSNYQGDKFINDETGRTLPSNTRIFYRTFDSTGTEKLRLSSKPSDVMIDDKPSTESVDSGKEGFTWTPLDKGGILTIRRNGSHRVAIMK